MSTHQLSFLLVAITALVGLIPSALAQQQNVFVSPSGPDLSAEKNYTIGQQFKLQWSTTWQKVGILLTQYDHDTEPEWLQVNVPNTNSYIWTVNTTRDYRSNPRFHLRIVQGGPPNNFFWSPGFFIWPSADSTKPTKTTSTSSTTAAAEDSPTGHAVGSGPRPATGTGATQSPTTTPVPQSGGLSTGAKIGVGVAVPLIVIIAGIAIFAIFFRRRKYSRAPQHGEFTQDPGPQYPPGGYGADPYKGAYAPAYEAPVVEAPGQAAPEKALSGEVHNTHQNPSELPSHGSDPQELPTVHSPT